MRKKLLVFLFLILLFVGFVGIRFFLLSNQDVYGKIRIISSPSSTVFIDNVAVGKTPYDEKLKVGEYLLKLIPEATATITASWQGKIRIYKNALTYVNRELGSSDITSAGEIFTVTKMEKTTKAGYGELYVETEPNGAIVYLDNDEKGVASVVLADILKGDHEVSVFMPGFLRRTEKIKIDASYRVNTFFKLAIDPSHKPAITTFGAEVQSAATESAKSKRTIVVVKDLVAQTELGYLRVREEPSVSASESAQVKAGEKFEYLDEKGGWYKIQYEKNKQGWVYSQYADKIEE